MLHFMAKIYKKILKNLTFRGSWSDVASLA